MGPKHQDAELYLRIAKTFAVDLTDEKDRVKALKWIKFLQKAEDLAEKRTKLHVTQLLLICLQRKRLVGPFHDPPDPQKKLLQYGWAYQPADIARLILKSEFDKMGKPPVRVELSGDLCEYVATQDIPLFGQHFYYAYSPIEIKQWDHLNTTIIPKGLLALSTAETPGAASVLVNAITAKAREKRRAKGGSDKKKKKKRDEFVDASMVDPQTGRLQESFTAENPESMAIDTSVLQSAVETGAVRPSDLAPPSEIADHISGPLVETVQVEKGHGSAKKRKIKNALTKNQKERAKRAFETIAEEEDDEDERKERERRENADKLEKQREEMLARMPAKLRERLQKKAEKKKDKTPNIFEAGPSKAPSPKVTYRKRKRDIAKEKKIATERQKEKQKQKTSQAQHESLDDEDFVPATQYFENLDWDAERTKIDAKLNKPSRRGAYSRTPSPHKSVPDEVQLSFDRSLQKRKDQRAAQTSPRHPSRAEADMSSRRRAALEKLNKLKAIQPRRIVFDDMDVEVEPEEVHFDRFVYTEFPDEDKTPSILEEDEMEVDDVFGDSQIANISQLPPAEETIAELDRTEALLDSEMQIDDVFGEDQVAEPEVLFREVTLEGDRQVASHDPNRSPREGGVRIGRRVVYIPGQEPMEQRFIEPYGDVMFDSTLRETDFDTDEEGHTPPMSESLLNRYLDEKLKKLKPGESPPRVYGPWAETFRRQLEQIDRGEEPEQDEESYPKTPPRWQDRSYLSDSEMDTSEVFGEGKTAIPSPVKEKAAKERNAKTTELYKKLMKQMEAKKAERIQQAIEQEEMSEESEDLLEPLIYKSLMDDRSGLLDASITDAGLGQALVDAPESPPKQGLLDSYERKMDDSLKLLYGDFSMADEDAQKGPYYDQSFLDRRLQGEEVPADESILEEDELDTDEMFGEEQVATPKHVRDLPAPRTPSPKSTPKRPTGHSHLYVPQRYKPRVEDIVPHDYLEEVSYPSDEYIDVTDLTEDVEEEDAEEDAAEEAAAEEAAAEEAAAEEAAAEEAAEEEAAALAADEDELEKDYLDEADMDTSDIFDDDQVMSPTRLRTVSPTTAALARSIKQSVDAHKLINKFRRQKGLEPLPASVPIKGVQKYVDARESLLDPTVQADVREQFPGLLDEPILEEDLDAPLIKTPKQADPFAEYEKQMSQEILDDRADELDVDDIIPDEEMEYDDIFGDAAEPPPVQAIPMPPPAKSSQKSPPKPLTHSHLFLVKPPHRPPPPRPQDEPMPDEMLEDEEEPQYEDDQVQFYELSPEDQELLEKLFDGDVPIDLQTGYINAPEQYSSDLMDSGQLEDILKRARALQQTGRKKDASAAAEPEDQGQDEDQEYEEQEDDDAYGVMDSAEMDTSQFDEDRVLSPSKAKKSPTKLIIDRSKNVSEQVQKLRDRIFKKLNIAMPEKQPAKTPMLDQLKDAEENLLDPINFGDLKEGEFGILDEPIVEEQEAAPLVRSPRRANPLEKYEKQMDDSLRRQQEEEEARDPSILEEDEMEDQFGEDDVEEPLPVRHIPMPPVRKSPTPSPQKSPPKSPDYQHKMRMMGLADDLGQEEFPEEPDDMDESTEEDQPPVRPPKRTKPPDYFDQTPEDGDAYYQIFSSPKGWRKPAALRAVDEALNQSKKIQDLRNRFRALRGLPPIDEPSLIDDRLQGLADDLQNADELLEDENEEEYEALPDQADRFASFERDMDQQLEDERFGDDNYLDEDELGAADEMFADDQVAEPPPVANLPMPQPPPRVPTPPPPAPAPVTHSHLYLVKPAYKSKLEDILPHEEIQEQSFPSDVELSILEYQPDPNIEDEPMPELVPEEEEDDEAHNEYFFYDDDDYDTGLLEDAEMDTSDMFGQGQVLSPGRMVPVSPSQLAQMRSRQSSKDVLDLRNRYRQLRGLPPLEEETPPPPQMYVSDDGNVFVVEQPEAGSPGSQRDPFESFEDQMDKTLGPRAQVQEHGATPKPSPMLSPRSPKSPRTPQLPQHGATPKPSPMLSPVSPKTPVIYPSEQLDAYSPPPYDEYLDYQTPIEYPSEEIAEQTPPTFEPTPPPSPERPAYSPMQNFDQTWKAADDIGPVQKTIAEKFGIPDEDLSGENLYMMSPPRSIIYVGVTPMSATPGTPGALPSLTQRTPQSGARAIRPPTAPADRERSTPKRYQGPKTPRRLFGDNTGRLSIHMDPAERIKQLIARQPKFKVKVLPKKSEFSPTRYITEVVPPQEDLIEMTEFPDEAPEFRISDVPGVGDLPFAAYIETSPDVRDREEIERRRREEFPTPPGLRVPTPPPRQSLPSNQKPKFNTEMQPGDEGFKWLANYMPFEEMKKRAMAAEKGKPEKGKHKKAAPARQPRSEAGPSAGPSRARQSAAPRATGRPPAKTPAAAKKPAATKTPAATARRPPASSTRAPMPAPRQAPNRASVADRSTRRPPVPVPRQATSRTSVADRSARKPPVPAARSRTTAADRPARRPPVPAPRKPTSRTSVADRSARKPPVPAARSRTTVADRSARKPPVPAPRKPASRTSVADRSVRKPPVPAPIQAASRPAADRSARKQPVPIPLKQTRSRIGIPTRPAATRKLPKSATPRKPEPQPGPSGLQKATSADQPKGVQSKFEISKTIRPESQSLLKKSSIVRNTGLPIRRADAAQAAVAAAIAAASGPQVRPPPVLDRKTIRKTMTVGEADKSKAVKKQSAIAIQKSKKSDGATMVKTNTVQSSEGGQVKKSESKFAVKTKPSKSSHKKDDKEKKRKG